MSRTICLRKPTVLKQSLAKMLALGLMLSLSACMTINKVTPGTPANQVVQEFGQPTYRCPTGQGKERLIWSQQPYGQTAWGAEIAADGRVEAVTQLLTDKHFQVLSSGTWTPERLLCTFGPPAEKTAVGLPSSLQIVWSWRYMQDGVWYSLMHVYLGRDGEKVTRFHPGPDPRYEADSWHWN